MYIFDFIIRRLSLNGSLFGSTIICGNGGHLPAIDTGDTQSLMRDAMRSGDRETWEVNLAKQFCGDGFREQNPVKFKRLADVVWHHRANSKAKWDPKISPPTSYWGLATMPALLIYGDEDKNGTSENAEDLNRRLPNAQLHNCTCWLVVAISQSLNAKKTYLP